MGAGELSQSANSGTHMNLPVGANAPEKNIATYFIFLPACSYVEAVVWHHEVLLLAYSVFGRWMAEISKGVSDDNRSAIILGQP